MSKKQIVLFQSSDGAVSLPVQLASESVWLTQAQMAQLFDKDRTVIGRHINNAIREGEIDPRVVCAKFAHTTPYGAMAGREQTQDVTGYNLEVVNLVKNLMTILCQDEAVIRYTLDGTSVTEESPIYTAPFEISETTTIRAKAGGPHE